VSTDTPGGERVDLYLTPAHCVERTRFHGEHLALFPGPGPDGGNPFAVEGMPAIYEQAEAAVRAADEAGLQNGPLQAFHEILTQYLVFEGRQDEIFRYSLRRESMIRLGFRCNQDCWFCWQDRTWPEPPAAMYYRWLDEIAEAGMEVVSLSGGEPTLHPELLDLVRRASQTHGMRVQVQTNAIRLTKPRYLESFVAAGVHSIFVSFHSADPEVSDRMTRAPRTHEQTVRGIEAALSAGLRVALNCCVERANFEGLHQHARFIVDRFVKPFPDNPAAWVTYSQPGRYFDRALSAAQMVPLDELRPRLTDAIRTLAGAGVPLTAVDPCGFTPCVLAHAPELLLVTEMEPITDYDMQDRSYGEVCRRCALKPGCMGVRNEYLSLHGERGLEPVERPPACTRLAGATAPYAFAVTVTGGAGPGRAMDYQGRNTSKAPAPMSRKPPTWFQRSDSPR
jgi:MoaA/NifB/PqqE/SkfB family radical SAM enzyme